MEPATSPSLLDRAWKAFDPLLPIEPDDPMQWYEDLGGVRDSINQYGRRAATRLLRPAARPCRELLAGHPGCGKSTELGRLRRELTRAGAASVLVEVDKQLDPNDLAIEELLLLVVSETGGVLLERGLELDAVLLKQLAGWFDEHEEIRTANTTASAEASAGLEAGGGPSLMKLLFGASLRAKLQTGLKVDRSRREVTRKRIKSKLSDFLDLVGQTLGDAERKLGRLVIVVDGLEKSALSKEGLSRCVEILIEGAPLWNQLPVPLVCTAPLQLLAEETRIENLWDRLGVVPAVPVAARPGVQGTPPYVETARERLRALMNRRVKLDELFERSADADRLIESSGGSFRDLFRLVRDAIDATEEGPIATPAVDRAINQRRIAALRVMRQADRERLLELQKHPERFDYDDTGISLLQREVVLPYENGGLWFGVHPALHAEIATKQGR